MKSFFVSFFLEFYYPIPSPLFFLLFFVVLFVLHPRRPPFLLVIIEKGDGDSVCIRFIWREGLVTPFTFMFYSSSLHFSLSSIVLFFFLFTNE